MEFSYVFLILCAIFMTLAQVIVGRKCCGKMKGECKTNGQSLLCCYQHYIPKVPKEVTIVKLCDNVFPHIRKDLFVNISKNHVTELFLKNNSIKTIDTNAFTDFINLRSLEISAEKCLNQTGLKMSFKSLKISKLKFLKFTYNGWESLENGMFDYLTGVKLEFLSLEKNKLKQLHGYIFEKFSKLNKLSCKTNRIDFVNASGLKNVQNLELSDNSLSSLPKFCKLLTNESLVPHLVSLSLDRNNLMNISKNSFKCLTSIQVLDLDKNNFYKLENHTFSTMPDLRKLHFSFMQELKYVHSHAFNIPSLQELYFTNNEYHFYKYSRAKIIFHLLQKLKKLDLTKNYLPKDGKILLAMMRPLKNLESLNLASTNIEILPDGLLQGLPFLEYLNLQGNKINTWSSNFFESVQLLRNLYLDGNDINIINEKSFPKNLLKSLERLELSDNHYWCTCDQKWFLDILRSPNITRILGSTWPKRYSCYYPEHLKFSQLSSYYPSERECISFKIEYIIIIAVASFMIAMFLFVIFMSLCSINMKNALYVFRVYQRMRNGYLRIDSSEDFEFDAYIVYCNDDRVWVHKTLLRNLEEKGMNVCIHERDFEFGVPIIDNIERYMDKSWKIIVVMSNDFAKSPWCIWELEIVQERRRRRGKEALVLIMYQKINSHHMTSGLKALLQTTPHLIYTEGWGESLFWKAVFNDINKSLSLPPTALSV